MTKRVGDPETPVTEESAGWATMGDGEIGTGKSGMRAAGSVSRSPSSMASCSSCASCQFCHDACGVEQRPEGQWGRWSRSAAGEDRMNRMDRIIGGGELLYDFRSRMPLLKQTDHA